MTNVWVHNLSPFLIQFSSHLGVRWYGLAYLTGFAIGAAFMIFLGKRGQRKKTEESALHPDLVLDYITYVVLGTMIGGRLGYAFFYNPDLLSQFTSVFPYWGVLRVWEGGMASHGGILGIICAALLFARRHKLNWLHLGDLTTLGGAIGIFFGRIANFLNGELLGRPCSESLWWAVKFPQDIYNWLYYDQSKLSSLSHLVRLVGVTSEDWKFWTTHLNTDASAVAKVSSTLEQIVAAIQNKNLEVTNEIAPLLVARHPSQLYEAALEGLLLFFILFWLWRKPRKPGFIGASFLSLYAVVRIFGEQFRMPDAHIVQYEFQSWGITRGQLISSAMLIASMSFWFWCMKRKAPLISGWGPEARAMSQTLQPPNSSKSEEK